MVVGAVLTLSHIPPPSWAVNRHIKKIDEMNQKAARNGVGAIKTSTSLFHLYSRISIPVSVFVDMGVKLL